MNGCRRRGERVWRSPLWSIRGREYTGGADVTDLSFVGARRRRRYEPRNRDRVFLRSEFIRTTRPLRKLADKFLGPFEIIGSAGPSSFILRFPVSMRRIHPV